jgi:hypothetical protein
MDKGKVQEALAILYLRLNGYFTSGLIVHSQTAGENQTEVDVLAVRFPRHSQLETEVGPSSELNCSDLDVDIIIGEVKSAGQSLQFNRGLRSVDSVSKILRWVGAFENEEIPPIASELMTVLEPKPIANCEMLAVLGPRNIRVRCVLFSPERDKHRANQPWFLEGQPIFNYLWRCLHPTEPRSQCATTYDFGSWGSELAPLVRYIKASPKPDTFKTFFEDFERYIGTTTGNSIAGGPNQGL